MPASLSPAIISPSDAFLPPTRSTSPIRNCSNGTTRSSSAMRFPRGTREPCRGAQIGLQQTQFYPAALHTAGRVLDAPKRRTRRSGFIGEAEDGEPRLCRVPTLRLVASDRTGSLGRFRFRRFGERGIVKHEGCAARAIAALHRTPQRSIEIGVRLLEIADDLEVDALDLRKVDLLDVHETEQLA